MLSLCATTFAQSAEELIRSIGPGAIMAAGMG
jgi:hypothetical protein